MSVYLECIKSTWYSRLLFVKIQTRLQLKSNLSCLKFMWRSKLYMLSRVIVFLENRRHTSTMLICPEMPLERIHVKAINGHRVIHWSASASGQTWPDTDPSSCHWPYLVVLVLFNTRLVMSYTSGGIKSYSTCNIQI